MKKLGRALHERRDEVARRRNLGQSTPQISEALGESYGAIVNDVFVLTAQGRILRRKRGPAPISKSVKKERHRRILKILKKIPSKDRAFIAKEGITAFLPALREVLRPYRAK